MRRATRPVLLVLALGLTGCLSPIVGAECEAELGVCGGACVDLARDPDNCGTCGSACAAAQFCVVGECSQSPDCIDPAGPLGCEDAGPRDAGPSDAGPGPDGNRVDGAVPDIDAAVPDIDAAVPDIDAAVPDIDAALPEVDAAVDAGAADAAGPIDASTLPDALVCGPDLECGGVCTDSLNDPDNCGVCGNACASGLCVLGSCVGGQSGHVVIIGHDFKKPRAGMNHLLGNAVFLTFEAFDPVVRVLAYRRHSTNEIVSGADSAIDQVALEYGRTWVKTTADTAGELIAGMATADVLVIYSQDGAAASDAELIQLGGDISAAVNGFLASQGIVVVMDGVNPQHGGTYQIAQAAGLFTAGGRATVTGQTLDVVAPGNSIGANVPLIYAAEDTSVSFDTSETVPVVEASNGQPVVVHRTVTIF